MMKEFRICEVCEHPNEVGSLECTECSADLSHVYPTTMPDADDAPPVSSPGPAEPPVQASGSGQRTIRMTLLRLLHESNGFEMIVPPQGGLIGREGSLERDFFATYPYVSNHHARIIWGEQGYELVDEQSMNGTLLNDRRLEPGQKYELRQGDKVVFANVAFTVRLS